MTLWGRDCVYVQGTDAGEGGGGAAGFYGGPLMIQVRALTGHPALEL
jgi:hypothetical protein